MRDGQLIAAFPIAASAELNGDPLTIGSAQRSADRFLEFRSSDGVARPGDWLVLATDAVLGWALRNYEAGLPIDWSELKVRSDGEFAERVAEWREQRIIRTDDTTLMLLEVRDDIVETESLPEMDATDGHAD